MIRLLVITTLYPNKAQFRHGIFVENRVKSLVAAGGVDALVVAPVPWMPAAVLWLLTALKLSKYLPLTEYRQYRDVPAEEVRFGIRVLHPRYLVIPKIGMYLTPMLLALSLLKLVARLQRGGHRWDLIDSHYFYPDGVAVALLCRWMRLPFIITARGSDINLIGNYGAARRMMCWAAAQTEKNLCVSSELKKSMIGLKMAPEKIAVVTNGIDETVFVAQPATAREALKRGLPVSGYTLAAVGNLVELKGQHLLIEAVATLPDVSLLIVGEGECRARLEAQVAGARLQERVRFLGNVPQQQLVNIYNAVDLVCLASSREGCANVLLEAIACGTPVLATAVGGNVETINSDEVGLLVRERSAEGLRQGIVAARKMSFDQQRIRTLSQRFWYASINTTLLQLYQTLIDQQADAPRERNCAHAADRKYRVSHK